VGVGLANTPDASPAIKTATVRPTTIFSEGDIFAFMALLDQLAWHQASASKGNASDAHAVTRSVGAAFRCRHVRQFFNQTKAGFGSPTPCA
jgi:hypothetical protein